MPGLSTYGMPLEAATLLTVSSQETLDSMATGATGRPIWPSDFSGLILWLQANQIQGIASGTSLSVWTDSSASASHATQPSAVSQGVYLSNVQGGLGGVSFGNGLAQVMNSPTNSHDATTLAMVVSTRTTAGSMVMAAGTAPTGSSRLIVNAAAWSFARGGAVAAGTPVIGQFYSLIGFAGSTISNTTLTNTGTIFAGSTATSGLTSNNLAIGAFNPSSSSFTGTIGEILVYNRNVTELERSSLDSYFRTKWAL